MVEETPDQVLRLRVDSGGCSGFQYLFTLDDAVHDDDMCVPYTAGPSALAPLHVVRSTAIV